MMDDISDAFCLGMRLHTLRKEPGDEEEELFLVVLLSRVIGSDT